MHQSTEGTEPCTMGGEQADRIPAKSNDEILAKSAKQRQQCQAWEAIE